MSEYSNQGETHYDPEPELRARIDELEAENAKLRADIEVRKATHTARYIATLKAHAEAMASALRPFTKEADLNKPFGMWAGARIDAAGVLIRYRRDFPKENPNANRNP